MDNKTATERLTTSEITKSDWGKIKKDLRFIELISRHAKKHNLRVIIFSGYAVDGCLGQVTRPHRDLDVQIYGQTNKGTSLVERLVSEIKTKDSIFSSLSIKNRGRQEYYQHFFVEGSGIGVDTFYIQVSGNPFDDKKQVVKKRWLFN